MARRHYSDNERAEALAILAANGGNLSATSRTTGVPRATLQLWIAEPDRAAPPEVRQEKVFNLQAMFQAELAAVFDAMSKRRGQAHYSDLSRAAGIYTDKLMALSNSLPTQPVDVTSGGKPIATTEEALALLRAAYRDAGNR